MAVRGQASKDIITKIILGIFKGSFTTSGDKEIRIPCMEGGEAIQIKFSLTAAKDNIQSGTGISVTQFTEPTEEEKEEVRRLLKELGIDA